MADRFLIVSDLHLCNVEDHADGWKSYKARRYLFDDDLADLVGRFTDSHRDSDRLTLVLNGDVFDFDLVSHVPDNAPWPVSRTERARGLKPTPEKSVWKLGQMLADHPRFVETMARFLAKGHRLVYIMGNHDREFYFDEVKDAFREVLRRRALTLDLPADGWDFRFEDWFYVEPGKLYAEHGQQYDYYSSFRHILAPEVRFGKDRHIALPMGNISNRYLMHRMGFFNPYATDYVLNLYSYVVHWLKYYAFTRRNLALVWLIGSLAVLRALLRVKRRGIRPPDDYEERMQALGDRFGLSNEQMSSLRALQRPPITNRIFRMTREFWIDRVLIFGLMFAGTLMLALFPVPLWVKLMVPLSAFPLLFFIYESAAAGETVFTIERKLPCYAETIAAVTNVPVVTFGHTHVPRLLPLTQNTCFVDSGTWAPIMDKEGRRGLKPGFRNYLWIVFENGEHSLRFDCWRDADKRRPGDCGEG